MSFTNPQENLQLLGLQSGMNVADLGAGAGHYVFPAAHIVGKNGHVCAVEIQKDLVTKVKNEAEKKSFENVDVVWSDLEKPGGSTLADATVDAVILSNILFQMNEMEPVIEEAYRILRTGGKALIIDWSDSYGGLGPPADRLIKSVEVTKVAEQKGFIITDATVAVGAHHWGIILQK